MVLPCVPATASTQRSLSTSRASHSGPGRVRQAALEQRLDHRLAARHDVADHDHVRRGGELRGLEALGQRDAERFELRAHRRIDIAVRAGDSEARGAREGGDAAHESAADAEDVDVHREVLQALTGGNSANSSSHAASICSITSATLAEPGHSSAALTM